VTDGEHVFAFFGSRGLYCYDVNGMLQWQKDFGTCASGMVLVREARLPCMTTG